MLRIPPNQFFVLNNKNEAVPVDDVLTWAEFREHGKRHVALTELGRCGRVYHVSTVFLGVDHGFYYGSHPEEYKPMLFETMIFYDAPGAFHDHLWLNFQHRYSTWAQAEAGHWEAVKRLSNGQIPEEEDG